VVIRSVIKCEKDISSVTKRGKKCEKFGKRGYGVGRI
jgi:hypothetical protein